MQGGVGWGVGVLFPGLAYCTSHQCEFPVNLRKEERARKHSLTLSMSSGDFKLNPGGWGCHECAAVKECAEEELAE